MLDSEYSDFYIGEEQIIDQEEQSIEIRKNKILENCALTQSKLKCKIVKICSFQGEQKQPLFHIVIGGKMYFYGIRGVLADYKIVLRCRKRTLCRKAITKSCNNTSYIVPLDLLKQIIQDESSKKSSFKKMLAMSDPRVYDLNNYDMNSFDSGKGHKCQGTEIDVYLKSLDKIRVKCKLLKIVNWGGYAHLYFENDGKKYIYRIRGIKRDYKIALRCINGGCTNTADILPSAFLKQIIQKSPKYSAYSKFFNESDPRVYDIKNYDINSFKIVNDHNCS
jgi:hypothetical protein